MNKCKRNVGLALLLAAALLAPTLSLADNILRVQGTASLTVAPDGATLSVGYSGTGQEAKAAQQQAANAIAAIVEAVEALGISEEDIATGYMNTYPDYSYSDAGAELSGYRVEHMLSITVSDLAQVGAVLDAALDAGANQANNISFYSSREEGVYLEALHKAVDNAAVKADALAIATGSWLGTLMEVNEVSTGYSPVARSEMAIAYDAMTKGGLGESVIAGDLTVTATVELVYSIR